MAGGDVALEALRAARALIGDPARWCRSAPARKPTTRGAPGGEPCHATDPAATRWCAAGALCHVTGRRREAPGFAELDHAARTLFGEAIGRVNDRRETTHAMILRCFDEAIARLEGHGPR